MEDLKIFYPIYDTETKVEKSFVNPFEEFVSVAVSKYYKDFETVNLTIKDFYSMSDGDIKEFLSSHFNGANCVKPSKDSDGKRSFSLSINDKFIAHIEMNKATFVVGDRGDNCSLYLYYKDNHLFDYLVNDYSMRAFYLFNEIRDSYHAIRILLCLIKMFVHFGDYAKYRTFNSIKANSVGPLLKKRLNITPDDNTQYLNIHYGVGDAIVAYSPSKGKMVDDFATIKTKKIRYNNFASDVDAFIKEIRNED